MVVNMQLQRALGLDDDPFFRRRRIYLRYRNHVAGSFYRVLHPHVFKRCGYPLGMKDVWQEALALITPEQRRLVPERRIPVVAQVLARGLLEARNFGGRERTIHTQHVPEWANRKFECKEIYTFKTGRYYAGWSGSDYWGEYDGEPAGLGGMQHHVVLRGYLHDPDGGLSVRAFEDTCLDTWLEPQDIVEANTALLT